MFSKELESSISGLFEEASKAQIQYITVEHLLLMVLDDPEVNTALTECRCNVELLRQDINEFLTDTIIFSKSENQAQPTLGFQRVLQRSVFHVQSSGKGLVNHINVLVAIFSEKESHAVFLLNKFNVSRLDIVNFISHGISKEVSSENEINDPIEEVKTKKTKNDYLVNLLDEAKNNKLNTLIGRVDELDRLIQILARKNKNNPILVGESGVGKTTIVDGLALKILSLIHI